MDQPTYTFDRKLLAACALTRRPATEGLIMRMEEVPTFESIFVDGRVAVGATGSMATVIHDGELHAEGNPISPLPGKMPFGHAALYIPDLLLSRLTSKVGPATIKIILNPDSVDWYFGDSHISVNITIDHPEDYDEDDNEHTTDYKYPSYEDLITRAIQEVDELDEPESFSADSAFSVTLGMSAMKTIYQIATLLGEPSHNIDGAWREGEAASMMMSGGTPNFHVVRYASVSGFPNNSIMSLVGSRSAKALGTSSVELFPEFALKEGCDRPARIWDDYSDDTSDFDEDEENEVHDWEDADDD